MPLLPRPLLTGAVLLPAAALLLAHGPILQPADYHAFADQGVRFGVPHAADVLSNLPFALVGLWGALRLWPQRRHPALAAGRDGYALFLLALLLTAAGSAYYHLAPDDARLFWDRLPIALACAGLLAAVHGETGAPVPLGRQLAVVSGLALYAVGAVAWWRHGLPDGDLRPYLLLQALPLVLIPLWQARHGTPRGERRAFGLAIGLYVLAKLAELGDHALHAATGHLLAGHTVKHLLAAAAAAVIVETLCRRVGSPAQNR